MSAIDFDISELNRRLTNIIRLGKVLDTNYTKIIPRVKIAVGDLETAWLPILTQRAGHDSTWWPLNIGEQVIVLSPSGELAQGVVLGSINQQAFPAMGNDTHQHRTQYRDGAVIEYNSKQHHLSVVLPNDATIAIVSEGGVSIQGDLIIDGDVKASGDISDHTRSMQADREIYNSHTHAGVKPGGGKTLPPQATQ